MCGEIYEEKIAGGILDESRQDCGFETSLEVTVVNPGI